ncbi:MAG: BatA (Bacteroides aerotolerance operon) [uncultured Sulfurovum sp.]|uniref:BatA (Bacteroides aerotolerance operon) n=1 Tax=uncultured Sulfurovum sp. TaxID=269237 RepID=A0A6S6T1R2_9BACT|nr:MAG: BatA (Bacteroides aerotolerance operon) [uncultured Sulfurovum sp.]
MNQFSFEYPWLLGLIVVFAVCAYFCKVKAKSIYFPHLNSLMLGNKNRSLLLPALKWLGIILAIVALASPVLTKEYSNSKKHGRDIVLIVDTSDSMRQQGFDVTNRAKNKFDVVKEVAASFVDKRENDRIGLITFADIAFVASPLTFETKFLRQIIGMQQLGIAGKRTAINDALVQSYGMLEKSKAKSKIVILLTDGVDNMSEITVDEVTSLVSKSEAKLYTIGIGTERDFDGDYLRKLAKAGKGLAFAARNSLMLTKIYEEIDRLEVSKIDDKKVVQHTYLFTYPLVFSILLLLFFIYFRTMRSL